MAKRSNQHKTCGYSDVGAEIMACLENYTDSLKTCVDEVVDDTAKELKDKIKADSPKRTGEYKKGWRIKTLFKGHGNHRLVIHNETNYQLTHLLEYGHAVDGGTKRVPAHPHIKKNEELFQEELEERIGDAISKLY